MNSYNKYSLAVLMMVGLLTATGAYARGGGGGFHGGGGDFRGGADFRGGDVGYRGADAGFHEDNAVYRGNVNNVRNVNNVYRANAYRGPINNNNGRGWVVNGVPYLYLYNGVYFNSCDEAPDGTPWCQYPY